MRSAARQTGHTILSFVVAALLAAAGCQPGEIENPGDDDTAADPTRDRVADEFQAIAKYPTTRLCSVSTTPGEMACGAIARAVQKNGQIIYSGTPGGFGPSDLKSAYKIPATGGVGMTIAIVDANDDPKAESDLAIYRSTYGLPPCTTANGCFKKVNQNGGTSYPAADSGWAGEIALDLDMASAACPNCKILLVEANNASMTNLGAAVNRAALMGANVISNSYGGPEDSSASSTDTTYFNHPGIQIFVSAGDSGYGTEYPASSKYVTAVGGTSLKTSTTGTRGWVEQVWGTVSNTNGGTGSGCSAYVTKPSWQSDTGCAKRAVSDVSAVADPNTGVAVYDSYGGSGWAVYGGTSAASPIAAAIFAATGNASKTAQFAYQNTTAFFDVTSGANGSCSGSYLCTAKAGYDGPTGVGTPNGELLASLAGGGSPPPPTPPPPTPTPPPPTTCTHGICSTGTKLVASCDSCATSICASDSYCCNTAWDSQCVSEVSSICGSSTCSSGGGTPTPPPPTGGTGTCTHSDCTSGTKLVKTCDPCVTSVCNADSYCCNTAWDSICVGEVASVCGASCP